MQDKYKIRDKDKSYFITMTTVGWVDVFTRVIQKKLIVEKPEDYLYSSARDYAGLDSFLDVFLLDHKPLIKNWEQARTVCPRQRSRRDETEPGNAE